MRRTSSGIRAHRKLPGDERRATFVYHEYISERVPNGFCPVGYDGYARYSGIEVRFFRINQGGTTFFTSLGYLPKDFFSFNFKVVAFKIIEKDLIYFINVSLSEKEFKNIKKSVLNL